jgi:Xaa-Pro aminopeptidase
VEFDREEYESRKRRAVELMEEHGMDAIVLTADWTGATNYRYLSGHLPRDFQMSYSRPHVFVMDRDGDATILAIYFSAGQVPLLSWVEDVREYSQPFRGGDAAAILREKGLANARIGFELGVDSRVMMPFAEFFALQQELPDAEMLNASPLLWELRLRKSDAEVERIARAAKINADALRSALSGGTPGQISETTIYKNYVKGVIDRHPAPRPPFVQVAGTTSQAFKVAGRDSSFLGTSDAILNVGDLVVMDAGCAVDGYWSEFSRMAVVGAPTEAQEQLHSDTRTLVRRSIEESLVPGATGKDVIGRLVEIFKDLGYGEEQYGWYLGSPYRHLCHGLGLTASEAPLVRWDWDEALVEGMTLAVEASIRMDDFRYCSEETVLITASGAEILSPTDTGLYTLPTDASAPSREAVSVVD